MPTPKAGQNGEARRLRAVSGEGGEGRPGLVSVPAGLHNLPRDLSSFVGRKQELAGIAELLGTSPLVTVTGPAGIGKTRLSLRVAAQLVPVFDGGVWLVELAQAPPTADPDVVAAAIAAVLEVRPEPGRSLTDALTARLGDTTMLLMLDNCEHLSAAAASVASDLLNGWPGLAVLATSQQPLGLPGEQVFALNPLSLPGPGSGRGGGGAGAGSDAVALFHARAKAVQPSFVVTEEGAAAVAEICRRLDGIPLAVELAAARTAVLSPTEIAEHLDERFSLLARSGDRVVPRHQSLQSALDWSYDLLPAPEKALLRRLSVFAGGAGLAHVSRVCAGSDVDARAIVDLLTALVSKSLVVAHTNGPRARYRLLESVRAYAHDRLEEAGETHEMAEAHADLFAAIGERGWHEVVVSNPRAGADALEREHDNLRAALGWLLAEGRGGTALGLASALTPFWKVHGHLREGREWLERALAASAAGPPVPSALRTRALWGVGILAMLQGELERATSALEEALELAREHDHQRAAAQTLNLLGFISVFTSDPAAALPLLEESVELARKDGDGAALISALGLYGRARLFSGDTHAAREVFEECHRIGRAMPDGDESEGLIGLGWVALSQGRHEDAQKLLEQALPAVRLADEHFEIALVLSFLGELASLRGDTDEARALLHEGLELARSMGAPYPAARCMLGLARVAWAEHDVASACVLIDEAVVTARHARLPYVLVRCLHFRADLHRTRDEVDAARAGFEEALSVATANGDKAGTANAQRGLAALLRVEGDYLGATTLHLEALDQFCECGDEAGVAAVFEGLGGLAVLQERAAHGARLLGAAYSVRQAAVSARSPLDQRDYHDDETAAHAALDDDQFKEAWTQGIALARADALTLAARSRGGRRRPTAGWASLTPTEAQVSDLVADGLSNNEIAERMFLSPRTVQGHVSRVFVKLGVASRRELRDSARQH